MSRIHISVFEQDSPDKDLRVFQVMSPDFSSSGRCIQHIGDVVVTVNSGEMEFQPSDILDERFFPPGYFNTHSRADAEHFAVESNLSCVGHAYRIFKSVVAKVGSPLGRS